MTSRNNVYCCTCITFIPKLPQSLIRIFLKRDIVFSDMGNSDTSARVLDKLEAGSTEHRSLRLFGSAYEESRGGGRIG